VTALACPALVPVSGKNKALLDGTSPYRDQRGSAFLGGSNVYPTLRREDVAATMAYAAELARERVVLTSAA
jgi:hypothetical protein